MGKIIVFDGMSTTGKSTVSSVVQRKLCAEGNCVLLHEESHLHPTRIDERELWDDSERFRSTWIDRWMRFLSDADTHDTTYVLDGCILHELERIFMRNGWDSSKIKEIFEDIDKLLSEHDVMLFLLYKHDLPTSFKRSFVLRDARWEQFKRNQLRSIQEQYFKEIYDDTMLNSTINRIQDTMMSFYQEMTVAKYELDATSEDWDLMAETAVRLWKERMSSPYPMYVTGIIWPTAIDLCRDVIEDLRKNKSVVWLSEPQIYSVDQALLRWVIHWAYRYDWIPTKIAEKKYIDILERCDAGNLSIVFFQIALQHNTYVLDNRDQRLHLHSVKQLKTELRELYKDRIKNYIHDVLMHLSDTIDQTLSLRCVHRVLEFIHQMDESDYYIECGTQIVLQAPYNMSQVMTHFADLVKSAEISIHVGTELCLFYRDECILSIREKEAVT